MLKHVTLYQKKHPSSEAAMFEPIDAVIFTHRHTCFNKPFLFFEAGADSPFDVNHRYVEKGKLS